MRPRGAERRGFWMMVIVCIVIPVLLVMTRRTWSGMRNVPVRGGAILACNHISHADPLPVAHFVHNAGRKPRFLAKASVFKLKGFGSLFKAAGQVPVYRGGADAVKSLHAAIEMVDEG
ncbi:MAG: lysophospholipid acyltransferase family protein, partial [Stackebrandtia sp.]